MKEWVSNTVEVLNKLPRDVWAFLLLIVGGSLTVSGHKEEGLLVLGGALGVFKGEK